MEATELTLTGTAHAQARRNWIGIAIVIALACALPFLVSNYRVFQLTLVLVYSIALLGLNLLTGYNGQISLGHGAFYAIGAYTAAILMDKAGMPYWMTIPVAGFVCLVVGFLFGLPALRLEGLYLALATFALAIALPQILKHKLLEDWTGGVQGIVIIKPDAPEWLKISQDQWLYFFTLAWVVLLFFVAWNLLRGRIGGLASISGAIYGAIFIQFVPNIADHISKAAPWAIFGVFLLAFIYVMPTGVAGFVRMVKGRIRR